MKPKPFSRISDMKIGEKVICLQKGQYGKIATVIEHRVVKIEDYFYPERLLTKTYVILKWEDGCNFNTQSCYASHYMPFDTETYLLIIDQQKRDAYADKYL